MRLRGIKIGSLCGGVIAEGFGDCFWDDVEKQFPGFTRCSPLENKPQERSCVEFLRKAGEDARKGFHSRQLLESNSWELKRSF